MPGKKLAPKRAAFVREYLKDLNATQAAIRAGYSEATATAQGSRLLSFVDVQAAIGAAQSKAAERADVTVDRIVAEYARLAFSKITDFISFGPSGIQLKASEHMSPDAIAAILEVRESKGESGTSVSFKLHSKGDALNALGRHLGMFNDKLEVKIRGALEEMLSGVRPRMSPQAYAELLSAVEAEMGLDDLAASPASGSSGGEGDRGATPVH